MALRGLLAGVSEVRIRAAVSFENDATAGIGVQRAKAAVRYVLPAASLAAVQIAVSVSLDSVGRNPFVFDFGVIADAATFSVRKVLAELVAASDQRSMVFGKAVADAHRVADSASLGTAKPLQDSRATSEVRFATFNKRPTADVGTTADDHSNALGKTAHEEAYVLEGPYRSQDYADPSYFLESYVFTGGPIFGIAKNILESVDATDDFHHSASGDDDQTVLFGKALNEAIVSFEALAIGLARTVSADLARATDAAAVATGKSVADSVGKSDTTVRGVGKSLSDNAASSESLARNTGKALSDAGVSSDAAAKGFSRPASDSAATSEAVARAINKALSDAAASSDAATRGVAKALADAVAKSDSGGLRKTDYTDIGYFAQDYVGTSIVF